jgi:hypothetical protein
MNELKKRGNAEKRDAGCRETKIERRGPKRKDGAVRAPRPFCVRQVYSRAPLARVMRIHQMLQNGKFPNCTSIARELEVATKTGMHDLEFMRTRLEWPIEYDAVRHGYFFSKPVAGFAGGGAGK